MKKLITYILVMASAIAYAPKAATAADCRMEVYLSTDLESMVNKKSMALESLISRNIGHSDNLIKRRSRYEAIFIKSVDENCIDKNLALSISYVESKFYNLALSEKGAAGLMQFMPATAIEAGLKLYPVDERYMPEKAIPAGIAHFRGLMEQFDNNVVLALAAYNSGQKRVTDSIKKYKKKAVVSRLVGIPAETKNFIFWVLAVKQHYDSIE